MSTGPEPSGRHHGADHESPEADAFAVEPRRLGHHHQADILFRLDADEQAAFRVVARRPGDATRNVKPAIGQGVEL